MNFKKVLLLVFLCGSVLPSSNTSASVSEKKVLFSLIREKDNHALFNFFKRNPGSTEWDLRNGQTAGHLLLNANNIDGFNAWLDCGATCSQKTDHNDLFPGSTILHALCFKNLDFDTFKLLLIKIFDRNPSILLEANNAELTPVYMLESKSKKRHVDLLKQLEKQLFELSIFTQPRTSFAPSASATRPSQQEPYCFCCQNGCYCCNPEMSQQSLAQSLECTSAYECPPPYKSPPPYECPPPYEYPHEYEHPAAYEPIRRTSNSK